MLFWSFQLKFHNTVSLYYIFFNFFINIHFFSENYSDNFDLVRFYGISTIVGCLMPNPLYTYILNIYDLVWLGLWHINHCRLFDAKSSLYIYIKYIWFGLVWFYGLSTIVGYLMPNPLYIHILDIYIWFVYTFFYNIFNWANVHFLHS